MKQMNSYIDAVFSNEDDLLEEVASSIKKWYSFYIRISFCWKTAHHACVHFKCQTCAGDWGTRGG